MTSKLVKVFFCYSHKDEQFREQLEVHLSMMKRQGLIQPWHDRKITPGNEWRGEIDSNLNAADIILLLVTANFLASDYCYDIEMKQAMQRHEEGEARVIAIILTPVEGWMHSPFAKLQILPKDGKPLTKWSNRDEAFVDIAQGIRRAIDLRAQSLCHPTDTVNENISQFEVGRDYILLNRFLSEGRWSKADEETCKIVLRKIGKSKWTDIVLEDVKLIPQSCLDQIDKLWNYYSDGKFGFKAQKSVWQSIRGNAAVYEYELFQKFGEVLGWRNLSAAGRYGEWLYQKELDFSIQANKGHLPSVLSPALTHPAIADKDNDRIKTDIATHGVTIATAIIFILLTGGSGIVSFTAFMLSRGLFPLVALKAFERKRMDSSGQLFVTLLERF